VSRVHHLDPHHPERAREAIDDAAAAIRAGHLIVLPTETVYGIAARPDDPDATRRVFDAKRRPRGLSLPVLVPDEDGAWHVGVPNPAARSLAAEHWPGPLTLVLERAEVSRGWELGEAAETIALRVPDHPLAALLLRAAGPIAATSANLSGRPPLAALDDLLEAFGDAVGVYLVAEPGAARASGVPSTIVDVSSGVPVVLREGPIRLGVATADPERSAEAAR
jgi:tRNA threonylcarbamoyl adenosine modification protein (Sua5/YciO/YrdC/YwlC family)